MRFSDGTSINKKTIEQMVDQLATLHSHLDAIQAIVDDIDIGWKMMDTPKGKTLEADMCLESLEAVQTGLEDAITSIADTENSMADLLDVWGISTLAFRLSKVQLLVPQDVLKEEKAHII